MATLYRSTRLWAVEYRHDGRSRHWVTALPSETQDAGAVFAQRLQDLYGAHAQLVEVRPATADEELAFVRGTLPRNVFCPVLRGRPSGEK